jgi:hypothetical protein
MLIRPAIGDTEPIRYRRPNPDGQFSGNILDEAMRIIRLNSAFTPATPVSDRNQGGTPCAVSREGLMLVCLMLPAMA